MKKNILLMSLLAGLLVSVISLSSCSNDDDPTPINVEEVVGYWLCVKSTDKVDGNAIEGYMVGKYLNINENGTYTSNSSSMGNGTWTLNGNKITVNNSEVTITATVTLSGQTLRLSGKTSEGIGFDYTFSRYGEK